MTGQHRAPLPLEIFAEVAAVPLTNGGYALIDAADASFVGRWRWRWHIAGGCSNAYVLRGRLKEDGPGAAQISLHAALMDPPAGMVVDHGSGDGLDCRRGNMRICTLAQNQKNKRSIKVTHSGLKGVHQTGPRRWRAEIMSDGVKHRLGSFPTADEAHAAYVAAAKRLHGEFARAA